MTVVRQDRGGGCEMTEGNKKGVCENICFRTPFDISVFSFRLLPDQHFSVYLFAM